VLAAAGAEVIVDRLLGQHAGAYSACALFDQAYDLKLLG
jgi:hypothetical protein